MKEVLPFIKKYKKEAVLAPAFKMTEALLELFVPLVVSSVIDVGIEGKNIFYPFSRRSVFFFRQPLSICLQKPL